MTLLIDFHNMLLALLHKHLSHIEFVSQVGTLLDLVGNVRVFWEDFFLQELLLQGVSADLVDGHVDELRFFIEANVVIANK